MRKGKKFTEEEKRLKYASRRGKKHSEEWCKNMSIALKGNSNSKGCIKSEETRKKMSIAKKGKSGHKHSAEHNKKISIAKKGKSGHKPSEETRKKISIANTGHKPSEETRKKMSKWVRTEETRKKISIGNKGKIISAETRKNLSIAGKKRWLNPEYAMKQMKAQGVSPNKPEIFLDSLLQQWFPNEWKFVGDGQVFINGKCPDFINVNGKKLLTELFGDYWHKGQNPEDRVKVFESAGYSTLVIWEKELKIVDKVKEKINDFMNSKILERRKV